MGQDKALLQLQGETLLRRTSRIALAVSSAPVWVIAARAAYQSDLPQGCDLLLEDEPLGPLVAFAKGLRQLRGPEDGLGHGLEDGQAERWVLLLACDLPLLTQADLEQAIAQLPSLPSEADAYLPPALSTALSAAQTSPSAARKPVNWEPLCGFYRQRCFTPLQASVAQGTRSFQHWLQELTIAPLEHWSHAHLLNCNRPQDWEQVQLRLRQSGELD